MEHKYNVDIDRYIVKYKKDDLEAENGIGTALNVDDDKEHITN
jgi:hypothetical protein